MPSSKRKRSGPGLSFAEREGRAVPGAGGASGANPGAKRSKRTGYNQVYRVPAKLIAGPGIFVTCVQGKERKAALQFIDHLNEMADRIYPGVQLLAPLPEEAPPAAAQAASTVTANAEDDEDLMDAMRNGAAAPAAPADEQAAEALSGEGHEATEPDSHAQPAEAPQSSAQPAKQEDDLEAQLRAELAELRGDAPSKPVKDGKDRGSKANAAANDTGVPTQRFKKIETDTECLLFISCARPIDPYTMAYAVLDEVERTGEPRSRFVQRLSPVSGTCSAHPEHVGALASRIIPQFFLPDGPAKTFKIDPRIRSHNTLTRDVLIGLVAGALPRDAGHRADLKNPDLWIVVEVHKNVCAIGIVRDYERFKKLNVQSVADAANARRAAEAPSATDTQEGRIAASLRAKQSGAGVADQASVAEQNDETEAKTSQEPSAEAQGESVDAAP